MRSDKLRWLAALLTALLLELPFPLAGPMPPWRGIVAWFGLVPLIVAVLSLEDGFCRMPGAADGSPRAKRRAYLLGYLAGTLWFMGNCYWIYATMNLHGHLSPLVSFLLLLGFSLVLGNYFALFTLGLLLIRRATKSIAITLLAAPFLWAALDLLAARFTSVPWDQLGYSQIDNALLTQLAPWTGVYGITFLLVASNALLSAAFLPAFTRKKSFAYAGLGLMALATLGLFLKPAAPAATATVLLIQPNLDVATDNLWNDAEWMRQMDELRHRATHPCLSAQFTAGITQLTTASVNPPCNPAQPPALIAWPESPAPFFESQKRFQDSMGALATSAHSALFIGGLGVDFDESLHAYNFYNSAMVFAPDGHELGRYDKIHLVPYGEYIPFQNLFSFAHKLTGRISSLSRGDERKVFRLDGQRYASFICYEAVFADEVRQFARLGGEVFINISDDGWYGDTSAPWQHLNMARMRAVENRRWILRDTNNGVTAAIDPYGTVRQSIPRHQYGSLLADFGYSDETTFYTEHGDVFAWMCAILSILLIGYAVRRDIKV